MPYDILYWVGTLRNIETTNAHNQCLFQTKKRILFEVEPVVKGICTNNHTNACAL